MPPKHAAIYDEPPEQFYGDGNNWDKHIDRVLRELMRLYNQEIFPIEEQFKYDTLRPSWFGESISQKKPFVTILGPFSAGKSTFINYLLQSNYLLTGPQPVTDKFTVIMHGEKHQQISGKVLCADKNQPFRGLNQFGEKFLDSFGAVTAPHPLLKAINIIDTPGLLENQSGDHKRRYDYMQVCRWFVERSDLVCVLFDPTKLDAGVELKKLFDTALFNNETKLRFILNKADSISPQELMRIYGGLYWNLSRLVKVTEPPRVYVSSFWDQPYRPDTNHDLFTDEKNDLIYDLTELIPLQSLDNRVTSVISRCKALRSHIVACTHMKEQLPIFGKEKAVKEMVANLPKIYAELARKHKCNADDYPTQQEYSPFFERVDLNELPSEERCARKGWLDTIDRVMGEELPALIKPIQSAAVADPRDRKHALMVQREYSAGMQRQMLGQGGVQGGLGAAATPAYRVDGLPNASLMAEQLQAQQQAQNQAQIEQMIREQQQSYMSRMQQQMGQMQMSNQMMNNQLALMGGGVGMGNMNGQMGMGGMGMNGMGQGAPLAIMPANGMGTSNSMLMGAQPQGAMPNMSHDQLLRLTQMMQQQQQPNRPHQPRF